MSVVIQRARYEDLDTMVEMARKLCAAARCERWWAMSDSDVRALIEQGVHWSNPICSLVAFVDDVPVGCIVGAMRFNPMNNAVRFAQEIIMWVDSSQRGQGIGRKLVEAFVAWAKERGVDLVAVGYTHGCTDESVTGICDKLGFEPLETNYVRRL